MIQIVANNGPELLKIERLEQHAGRNECFERLLSSLGKLVNVVADFRQRF